MKVARLAVAVSLVDYCSGEKLCNNDYKVYKTNHISPMRRINRYAYAVKPIDLKMFYLLTELLIALRILHMQKTRIPVVEKISNVVLYYCTMLRSLPQFSHDDHTVYC